jgi:hypothetical protein
MMLWYVLLGVGILGIALLILIRKPKPSLDSYRQRYDAALRDYQAHPKDATLKQEALRQGRAYYLQRAGQTVSKERQYSIEAMLTQDLERALKKN